MKKHNWFFELALIAFMSVAMAATWYVDPAATGNNDGSTWTDAHTDPNWTVDSVAAGDSVLLRGTYAPSGVYFNINATAGTGAARIKWIGVNAAGVDDGTPFLITADNYGIGVVQPYNYLKNFEISGGSNNGIYINYGDNIFHNFYVHDCARGVGDKYYTLFYKCSFRNNTSYGITGLNSSFAVLCEAIGNGSYGIGTTTMAGVVGCVNHGNALEGIYVEGRDYPLLIMHNTCDKNADGIGDSDDPAFIVSLFNRLTDNVAHGLNLDDPLSNGIEDYNFYLNNGTADIKSDGDLIQPGNSLSAGTLGYVDTSTNNFTLDSSATMRRTWATVGCVDSANLYYGTAGLPPADTACAAGGGGAFFFPYIMRHGN